MVISYDGTPKKWIKEPAKDLEVIDEVDVLVVGGGAAGFGAAVLAAQHDCKTLLIERESCLGGLFTLGLVCIPLGYVNGAGRELFDRLEAVDAHRHRNTDPEKTKRVMDEMLIKSGSDVLFMSQAVEAVVDESNTIVGVVIESKSGRQVILARRVIDASGDGDVAAFAGAPWECGRKVDGLNMATSLEFRVANVDWERHKEWRGSDPKWEQTLKKAVDQGDLPFLIDNHVNWTTRTPGRPEGQGKDEISICLAHSRYCHTLDARDLTRMYVEGREQVEYLVEFLRNYIPGFEECWLIDTGPLLGVRDSRRIMGEYVLTAKDLASGRIFDDAIARSNHGYDIHGPTGPGNIKWVRMNVEGEDRYVVCNPSGRGSTYLPPRGGRLVTYDGRDIEKESLSRDDFPAYYTIPYRSLVPLRVDNLLVAGRCLSATFPAQSGSRLIMTCLDMGQAAGTAAALSLEAGCAPRELDVGKLQDTLENQGIVTGRDDKGGR